MIPFPLILDPEQIEAMNTAIAARRACLLEAYRRLTPEQQANVIEELAELSEVTEWEDERNSRPFPY